MKDVSFSIMRSAVVVGFGCLMLLGLVPATAAQAARSISTVGRRLDELNRLSEKAARDELDREMRGRKPTAEERRLAAAKKVQIKEDFVTLQATYNDVLTRLQTKESLSNQFLSQVTEKISKSGSRLRHNIEFPVKTNEESKAESSASQPASIKMLCIHMHAFLTSPIFETGVLDILEAGKARDTLDKIIQTSESIRNQLGKVE